MRLNQLYKIIENRKAIGAKDSYISSLFNKGEDRIIQKIGEEATEVVVAAKNELKEKLIFEISDLLFHLTILMVEKRISFEEVLLELEKRNTKKI